jgi:hypothetical protein
MLNLEPALRELEIATAALAEIPVDHLEAAQAALDRRSRAIEDLAKLTRSPSLLPSEEREDTLLRLQVVCQAGAQAQQRLAAFTREAMAEWRQWSWIYRALGAPHGPGPFLDCRG